MRYLDAVAWRPLDRPPVWLMRQAGRYLPEYRQLREQHGFQECVATPELAAELTLQPIRRFGMDAAIIFADIMTPVEAMGVDVSFDPGPVLAEPVRDAAQLRPLDLGGVEPTCEALRMVRNELDPATALIGFCGAPFTLAAYLVDAGGTRDFLTVRAMAADPAGPLPKLLEALADAMAAYLQAQFDAGADAVQLFDSWAGLLSRDTYKRLVVPALERLLGALGRGPITYFAPDASHLLDTIGWLPVDVVGVDWRMPIREAWRCLGDRAIQGNIDPAVLLAGPGATRDATLELLQHAGRRPGCIVNTGHGLLPATPVESVATLVETVRSYRHQESPWR